MKREWTEFQKQVIDNKDKNLLVSAAAGSGKTAVLVARIIKMITDPVSPIDIDKLAVITFTRAAAAQMKQKISDELEKLIEKEPENVLYRRQQKLVCNANICTIDSFCINIVRSYFQKLELDPAFRMADDTELKLIKSDCMDEIMEKYHEEGSEEFYYLIEAYCSYKSDEKLTEYIYSLARHAESAPWPVKWLESIEKDFSIENGEKLSESGPAQSIFRHVKERIRGILNRIDRIKLMCTEGDGAPDYLAAFESDEKVLNGILNSENYKDMGIKLNAITYEAFSRKKSGTAEAKEKIKKLRDKYKNEIEGLKKTFFPANIDEAAQIINKSLPAVKCLINMTKDFLSLFAEKKRERNVIDFSDAEHFALNILWGDTPEALELRKQYHEIIIDEYQDSNNVQEFIANSIAGTPQNRPYIFTVGDVKQSIYKFRNACPELFIDKQERYDRKEDNGELIILDNNFRSREEVLDSTNAVFKHVMRKELGGIDYNDKCSLKRGLDSQKSLGDDSPYKTEVIMLSDENADITTEARLVANRIKKLIFEEKLMVPDEEKEGALRPVRFSDIVILLRTIKGWASEYADVFEEEGVPVFTEDSEGFFKSQEVKLLIDFLNILDNPQQDIPFAAVLHSVIAGLNEEELAIIRICSGEKQNFYEAALKVSQDDIKTGTGLPADMQDILCTASEKLKEFFLLYNELQEYRKTSSVSELIEKIYSSTGMYYYYSAMSDGERRKANLDMLPSYAATYETTSYSGLFSFIRYYEKLKSKEIDYGESGSAVVGNCVRIMSIHKSKGLEFPVVFVSGLGKQFNFKDLSGDILISSQHGLGIKYVDIEKRIKYPSFYHAVISMRGHEDIIGEEIRLLYVAMTRAKDKLILTGQLKNQNEGTDYASLFKAKCFLDFIFPVLNTEKDFFDAKIISNEEIEIIDAGKADDVIEKEETDVSEDEIKQKIRMIHSAKYPYSSEEEIPVKMSVSELKHMQIEEEFGENMFEETREFRPGDRTLPDFISDKGDVKGGTGYGTLVHKCMQFMPMEYRSDEEVEVFLNEMEKKKRITGEEHERLHIAGFVRFLNDTIAERIRKADKQNRFYREKQFMITIPAERIDPEKYKNSKVPVPVQGVIDAMFEEDGELVILDYKTDSLKNGEEEKLIKLYRRQLNIYAEAAERLIGKKVKEKLLYSFSLGKIIEVRES
ncbi:MAG: helicase-exonuclease AddAB subunit AddA [Lachnospiraceae bacterium]|nr:helicase-exonuclease AddAB subunit AddA [Lachnospiraceae bacterium]